MLNPGAMRTKLLFVSLVMAAASSAGCFSESWYDSTGSSEIVFGINQSMTADGKTVTKVGYEMLDLGNRGWSTIGFSSRERSCWAERLEGRLGQPKVDGGVAIFEGGLLPPGGIAVVANRPDDLTLDAPAWAKGGDTLTFHAKGFAMPPIDASPIQMPSPQLEIASPVPTETITLKPDQDFTVSWIPGEAPAREAIAASFVTEAADGARGVELRCFFNRSAGKGTFPKEMVARFADLNGAAPGEVKGKLGFATHRQLTILAKGGWIVYVVATADQREQPFVLAR